MTNVNVANVSDDVLPTEILGHGAYVCLMLNKEIRRELLEPTKRLLALFAGKFSA